ncbi:LAQU0S21e00980g1_1 [Lachancea quebecensis]|uniref:LAQU0S21e00980g1_1 n=1 Tax=Lachancea quebecensis TaxID=1654605 RepID=A0A0P1KZJ3_9SACH|nr:LAQU0S21e00980g1_1 [Lachancea quebecensis]
MNNFKGRFAQPDGAGKPQSQKHGGSSMMDDGVFDKLQIVISGIDLLNEEVSNDYQPVISFFSSKFAAQIVQSWSYYAQVNNHQKFSSCTSRLAKALRVLGSDSSTLAYGSILIRSILQENAKVLYRGLNNMKPSITNPMLRLLRQIIAFNKGQHVDDFLTCFDMSLPSLPRLLSPTKAELSDIEHTIKNPELSMRYNFIQFWLCLIENATPILRKAVLTENPKIMSSWYKHMTKVDSVKLLIQCLNTLLNSVLKEKSLKRVTKCKILNESLISKIHFFYSSTNADLVKLTDLFFESYSSVKGDGVAFSDDKIWFSEPVYSSTGANSGSTGALVVINNRKFYLYNKLLFTMLTFFKPWEDELQLNRVIKVLENVPELVAPYSYYLGTLGNHDPKMTSYWFGMTLLLGRMMNLPIPSKVREVQTDKHPSSHLVMESIIPNTVTKSALTKSLVHDVDLIKQMGCQLVVFSFKKLDKVTKLYDEKGWSSAKIEIINLFKARIPELSSISSALEAVGQAQSENKVLSASLSMILNYYSKFFPLNFSITLPSDNIFVNIMKSETFNGLDLVMLDNFLHFQQFNNSHTKWYNPNSGENSIFTSLLRLASSANATNSITNKVTDLLENLLNFTVLFNSDELLASPVLVLINSLQVVMRSESYRSSAQESKIWKLLDETVARCMKTPYKYVDMSVPYGNCSPFLVALIEQWSFVDKQTPFELVLKWMLIYLRSCYFVREPVESLKPLLQAAPSFSNDLQSEYLNFESYDDSLNLLQGQEYLLSNNAPFSFFQHITLVPTSDLDQVARYPINELDVAGLLARIQFLIQAHSSSIDLQKFCAIVDNLLMKAANYTLSQDDFKSKFSSRKYFAEIIITADIDDQNQLVCEKNAYVTNSLLEIYLQLDGDVSEVGAYIHDLWQKCVPQWSSNPVLMSILIKGLQILSASELLNIQLKLSLKHKDLLSVVLTEMAKREIHLSGARFLELLAQKSHTFTDILSEYLTKKLVENPDFESIISLALEDTVNYPIIVNCLEYEGGAKKIIAFLDLIKNESLCINVAAAISDNAENTETSFFVDRALHFAFDDLSKLSALDFEAAMRLFYNYHANISEDLKHNVLEFLISQNEYRFNPWAAKIVGLYDTKQDKSVSAWMQKSALYITKTFAERDRLSSKFSEFLQNFKVLLFKGNIWSLGVHSILETQIEVILGGTWVCSSEALEYLSILLLGASNSLNSNKMLQLLLNNEQSPLSNQNIGSHARFLTAAILSRLFHLDPAKNASLAVQEKLLLSYNGSVSADDRIILDVLKDIESRTLSSWTNDVFLWDYQEDSEEDQAEDTPLITKEREGLVLIIKRARINTTVENFVCEQPSTPQFASGNIEETWQQMVAYEEAIELMFQDFGRKVYDPLFILLLIANNEELLRNENSSSENQSQVSFFDMRKVVTSGLLELVILSLSQNNETRDVALALIYKMLDSLKHSGSFKDSNIFQIFLMKIAYTFHTEKNQEVSHLVWYMVSRLSSILTQPSSVLYEKAYKWVLASPFVQPQHLPLYDAVVVSRPTEDGEHYYKYLNWFLEAIQRGVKSKEDIKLLRSRNLLEWMMNLLNSPYISFRQRNLLNLLIYRIQRIETGGPTLITRYAGVSFLEALQESPSELVGASAGTFTNTKNKLRLKQLLVSQQLDVNYSELGAGYAAISKSHKRLAEWMEGDVENVLKRVCTADNPNSR